MFSERLEKFENHKNREKFETKKVREGIECEKLKLKGKNPLNNYEYPEDWKAVIVEYTKLELPKKIKKDKIVLIESTKKRDKSTSEISIKNSKLFNEKKKVVQKLDLGKRNRFKLWDECITNAHKYGIASFLPRLWETWRQKTEKYAVRKGENIDINRRESPFKVIILQIVLKNSQ